MPRVLLLHMNVRCIITSVLEALTTFYTVNAGCMAVLLDFLLFGFAESLHMLCPSNHSVCKYNCEAVGDGVYLNHAACDLQARCGAAEHKTQLSP